MIDEYSDEELIEALESRDYIVYERYDDPSVCGPEDFSNDELISELASRGYDIYDFETGECVSDPKKDPYRKEDHLSSEYIIQRDFDRHQLRAHLVNITGQGSYVSDDELIEQLKKTDVTYGKRKGRYQKIQCGKF